MRHRRSVPLLLCLGLLFLALVAGSVPSASADDPVQQAQRDVAALRSQVAAATRTLQDGTRALERRQAELAVVRRSAAAARRQADVAQRTVQESRVQLSAVVSAAYRRPPAEDLILVLSGGPDSLRDSVLAQADLDHVRGDQEDLLRQATAERVRADTLVRKADSLERDAEKRSADVARRVDALRSLATATEARLEQAAARLASAQAARRAALERAAQARAARSRVLAVVSTGASCSGASTSGYADGFLPEEALCPLDGAPGHRLRADAAAAFNRMTAARHLCVTDSYRSYAAQVDVYRRKPELAAVPGTSNHGWGLAVDLGCGAERFGSDTYLWLKANAGRFGFHHPGWAEPGGSKPEPWHWEYSG